MIPAVCVIVLFCCVGWLSAIVWVQNRELRVQGGQLERAEDRALAAHAEHVDTLLEHARDRDAWAEAAATERRELLDDVRVAYANMAQAAYHAPTGTVQAWPDTGEANQTEDALEREERQRMADDIDRQLAQRLSLAGMDDASLASELQ